MANKKDDKSTDYTADLLDAGADAIKDPKKRNAILGTISTTIDVLKGAFTVAIYLGSTAFSAARAAWPTVKAGLEKAWQFTKWASGGWVINMRDNWLMRNETGNWRPRKDLKLSPKQWWQTVNFPLAAVLAVTGVMTAKDAPEVKVADWRDDPIYLMLKPQIKELGGEKEWTVSCEFLNQEDRKESDINCGFSMPDNWYLDTTYRIKDPFSFTSWTNGYSPRQHAAQPMQREVNQYCAINSYFHEPVFGAERLPPMYRPPICDENLDTLVAKLEETGEVYDEGGNLYYSADDQPWWITGALATLFDKIGNGIDGAIEALTPDEEPVEENTEENTEENKADGEKTSMVEFNTVGDEAYAYNDNAPVTVTASVSLPQGMKAKVA